MKLTPELLPELIETAVNVIDENAEEVTALDQAIGDGDHVTNLQRGLDALQKQAAEFSGLSWDGALQKTGMTLMSTMGGASGSLFGTLFVAMAKAAKGKELDWKGFADVLTAGVDAVKKRGKADVGEKTMLDVWIPVEKILQQAVQEGLSSAEILEIVSNTAVTGMESTRDMIATKGRASFMEERTKGHIDAGARTSQLMICAIIKVLENRLS